MIYTMTFNPSLDYIVSVKEFKLGLVNRTCRELIYPGGKGINVSLVLKNLGFDSTALGFVAGFTGDEIERRLWEMGCFTDFIRIPQGMSRINVKLRAEQESEINGRGPVVCQEEIKGLYEKLDQLREGDVLVLAGSIPESMPDRIYQQIMERYDHRGIDFVVDATGSLLSHVLPYHPFLIKPNKQELGELFGKELCGNDEVIYYGKKMKEAGARNVLVSMAGEGAILIAADGAVYESKAPEGKVVNSVGAGDSMVAGFLAGYLGQHDYEKAFYMGLCTGSASAFSEELAKKEEVEAIIKTML